MITKTEYDIHKKIILKNKARFWSYIDYEKFENHLDQLEENEESNPPDQDEIIVGDDVLITEQMGIQKPKKCSILLIPLPQL